MSISFDPKTLLAAALPPSESSHPSQTIQTSPDFSTSSTYMIYRVQIEEDIDLQFQPSISRRGAQRSFIPRVACLRRLGTSYKERGGCDRAARAVQSQIGVDLLSHLRSAFCLLPQKPPPPSPPPPCLCLPLNPLLGMIRSPLPLRIESNGTTRRPLPSTAIDSFPAPMLRRIKSLQRISSNTKS